MKENKNKKEKFLLRLDPELFFKLGDFIQKQKRKKGRGYSINTFIIEAIEEKLKKELK